MKKKIEWLLKKSDLLKEDARALKIVESTAS